MRLTATRGLESTYDLLLIFEYVWFLFGMTIARVSLVVYLQLENTLHKLLCNIN